MLASSYSFIFTPATCPDSAAVKPTAQKVEDTRTNNKTELTLIRSKATSFLEIYINTVKLLYSAAAKLMHYGYS